MSDLFLLSPSRMSKIEPIFHGPHSVSRVDDRRVFSANRYDRCAHTFFSANCIAATLCYWL